jgi:hypothetical protein
MKRFPRRPGQFFLDEAGHEICQGSATPGRPLADSARRTLEPGFGHDFSGLRVHDDSQAADSSSAVDARAYTVGNHVVLGAGHNTPETNDGNRLLAHQLTHVVKQSAVSGGGPHHVDSTHRPGSIGTFVHSRGMSETSRHTRLFQNGCLDHVVQASLPRHRYTPAPQSISVAIRSARAAMVRDGFTPSGLGTMAPSATYRFS